MNKQISQEIIDKLLNKPTKIFEKFHEETKIKANPKQNKSRKIPDAWKTIFYKSYPRLPQIFLPAPKKIILPLMTALKNRRSSRNFGKKPITLEELSTLFYFTSGLNNSKTGSRFYPSAGGRYPIESYVISLNTELSPGLYHYQIKSHALELLVPFKNFKISKYFVDSSLINRAACVVLFCAVFERTTQKYGSRGYRHILIETGCMLEIAYVMAGALSFNICAVGGYKDDQLHSLLDIDGLHEAITGVFVFGHKT